VKTRRQLRVLVRLMASRAVLVLAALVILVGVVRGGTRFFYCPMAHLAFDTSPCATSDDDSTAENDTNDTSLPAIRSADCCIEKWRAKTPTASVPEPQGVSVPPATVASLLVLPRGIEIASAQMPFEIPLRVRAGPPPPRASERRAELMVFHN
jgi:hypothetical protein